MKSIRKRILVRVLGLLLVSTLIMGWASHHDSTHEVEELFDAQLGQSARVLIGLLGASQGQIPTEQLAQALLEYETLAGDEITKLLEDGKIDRPDQPGGTAQPKPVHGSAIPKSGKRYGGSGGAAPQGA